MSGTLTRAISLSTRRTLLLQNLARKLAGRVHIMQVCWLLLSALFIVMNKDMNMFKEREYEHVQIHLYPHIEFYFTYSLLFIKIFADILHLGCTNI